MKKKLLIFLVLIAVTTTIQAQKVVIKDSGVAFYSGSPYARPHGVNMHITNRFCKDSIVQSSYIKTLYSYNGLQQNTEVLEQKTYSGKDTFLNFSRTLYTYTATGKRDTTTLQFPTSFASGVLENDMQTRRQYDANDYLRKMLVYYWDNTYKQWEYNGENTYFTNREGRLDSMYGYTNNIEADTLLATYSYYPSGKLYQTTWYTLDNSRTFEWMTTLYYDSSGYTSRDSSVTQKYALNSDSLFTEQIISNTHYYGTDGNETELHTYYYLANTSSDVADLFRTYYFYGNCYSVLPVSFLSFSARAQNSNVMLQWTVASGVNASSYLVQRSSDGVHFTTIGTLPALSSHTGNSYTYNDVNALLLSAPKLYYRLAEEDNSGNIHYSDIASLSLPAAKVLLTLSPNPVINNVSLWSSVGLGQAVVTISDIQGKTVYRARHNMAQGSRTGIDVTRFAKGMYIVTVQSTLHKEQLKMIKE